MTDGLRFRCHFTPCSTCAFPVGDVDSEALDDSEPLQESQLLSQLQSIYLPSPSQANVIKSEIAQGQSAIAKMDEAILRLRTTLSLIESRREALKRCVDLQCAVVAPIRRVPDDVIAEIFLFACLSGSDNPGGEKSQSKKGTRICLSNDKEGVHWALDKVCRRWRNVVISLGEVYTNIGVDLQRYPPELANPRQSVANKSKLLALICLRRSGARPLHLNFSEWSPDLFDEDFFNIFWSHAHRWTNISMPVKLLARWDMLDFRTWHSVYLPPLFPILRKLDVSSSATNRHWKIENVRVFQAATSLTHISLKDITFPYLSLSIPWSHITHFISVACQYRTLEFRNVLNDLEKIVELTLRETEFTGGEMPTNISLKHLRKLDIRGCIGDLAMIIRAIAAPHLLELSMGIHPPPCRRCHRVEAGDDIPMNVRRSCNGLRKLDLLWMPKSIVTRLLAETTAVEQLVLRTPHSTTFQEVWNTDVGGPTLVPRLQTLILDTLYDQDVYSLVDMLQPRVAHPGESAELSAHLAQIDDVEIAKIICRSESMGDLCLFAVTWDVPVRVGRWRPTGTGQDFKSHCLSFHPGDVRTFTIPPLNELFGT